LEKFVEREEYIFTALGSSTELWMHLKEKYEEAFRDNSKFGFPVHCPAKT